MALDFAPVTSYVDFGSDAGIDNLDPYTYILWLRRPAEISNSRILSKESAPRDNIVKFGNGPQQDIQFLRQRATTRMTFQTNDTPINALDTWYLVACTADTGVSPAAHIYVGTLIAEAVESTYSSSTDGAGALTDDAAATLKVGWAGSGAEWEGEIAVFALIARALTLAQVRSWQFRPRVVADTKVFCHLGFAGTGTQTDWSGNGNNGTLTNAPTVADHVPLGPPFGFDLGWMGAFFEGGAPPPGIEIFRRRIEQD